MSDFEIKDLGNNECSIEKYNGTASDLQIPATIDGLRVVKIGDNAFEDCQSISKVVVPEGVVSIGDECFILCKSLTEVYLPDSLECLGLDCFKRSAVQKISVGPDFDTEAEEDYPSWLMENRERKA